MLKAITYFYKEAPSEMYDRVVRKQNSSFTKTTLANTSTSD